MTIIYIYQYNELSNGHSILDKRLSLALSQQIKADFISVAYNLKTKDFVENVNIKEIDSKDSVIILSHFNMLPVSKKFRFSKIIFINHDLPYYAYILQKDIKSILKAAFSWLFIHYYWQRCQYIFFISNLEFKKAGLPLSKSSHIRIGAKPIYNQINFDLLSPIVVFTGNYKWSLKEQALNNVFRNKYEGQLQLVAINVDDCFKETAVKYNTSISYLEDMSKMEGIKIGVITDDFLSGFKLKALELITLGCCLVSFSDIRAEFEGIPHADLFIHVIDSLSEVDEIYMQLNQLEGLSDKFSLFYNEIHDKFNWNKTASDIFETISKLK